VAHLPGRFPKNSPKDAAGRKADVQPATAVYMDSMKRLAAENLLLRDGRLNAELVRQQKILVGPPLHSLKMILTATTKKDINSLNSVKEFKNIARHADHTKMSAGKEYYFGFLCKFVNNELTYEQISEFFT